jgi:ABC-type transport system involved in cytochrome c biogenesis permease subunit
MQPLIIGAAALYLFGGTRRPVFIVALALILAHLAMRGISLGRLPLVGPHDTMVFFSASIGLMALPFLYSRSLGATGRFAWPVAFMAALVALLALPFPARNMPLPAILSTLWFELHVALAFFAYALFAIAAVLAILFLRGGERPLMDLTGRAALVGFTFFSLSMITGGIWGYYAWGTYWLWTPKELWTSILWLWYAAWLHLRYRGPSSERLAAWGAVAGLAVTLFTYLGVSLLMKSSHSF